MVNLENKRSRFFKHTVAFKIVERNFTKIQGFRGDSCDLRAARLEITPSSQLTTTFFGRCSFWLYWGGDSKEIGLPQSKAAVKTYNLRPKMLRKSKFPPFFRPHCQNALSEFTCPPPPSQCWFFVISSHCRYQILGYLHRHSTNNIELGEQRISVWGDSRFSKHFLIYGEKFSFLVDNFFHCVE